MSLSGKLRRDKLKMLRRKKNKRSRERTSVVSELLKMSATKKTQNLKVRSPMKTISTLMTGRREAQIAMSCLRRINKTSLE
jgi:hypothetical protein